MRDHLTLLPIARLGTKTAILIGLQVQARWSRELPHIDPEAVRNAETLQDMEAHLISPMFGYGSVQEYYR